MLIGDNGIINKAKLAREKSENAQKEEKETMGEYEKLIAQITGSRDENVTININELTNLINQIVDNKINNVNGTPTGSILAQMGNNAPEGYLFCDGTEYNINDYKNLAEYIKNQFGSYDYFGGNGTTTFSVPNLKGEFLRGTGTNSHSNQGSGGAVGKHQDATKNAYFGWNKNKDLWTQTWNPSGDIYSKDIDGYLLTETNKEGLYWHASGTFTSLCGDAYYLSRPTNTSVLYCIKY